MVFQFPKFELKLPSLIGTSSVSTATDNSSLVPSNIPLQFRQRQHIYYTPKNIIENEQEHVENVIDPHSIGLELRQGEKIILYQRPALLYMKNVLILFILAFLFFTFLLLFPIWYISFSLEGDNEFIDGEQQLSRNLFLTYIITYILVALYIFVVVYVLFYKLLYKRLMTRYILTNKRAIIARGFYPLERLLNRISKRDINFITSWKYKEIGELFFTLHNNESMNNSNSPTLGSVYFGYKVDRYILPFSTITYATSTGFLMVPDVYRVLDIMIHQCQQHHTAITSARLIKEQKDAAIRSYNISRAYGALCGINICWCCISQQVINTGKISEEEYKSLTLDAAFDA